MMNVRECLTFPSATTAFFAYLVSRNYELGSEAIISPLSWVADYSALLFNKMAIRFATLDEQLQVTVDSIEEQLSSKTRLVVIPHLMGRGQQNIEKIAKLCNKNSIDLVEDIAQSFGVKIKGNYAGRFGHMAFSSFNHHKIISTGEGGMAVTNDPRLYKEICQIHDQGCVIKNGKRQASVDDYIKGLSLRVNEMTAAVAFAQLARYGQIKRKITKRYKEFEKITQSVDNINLIVPNQGDLPSTALVVSERTNPDYPSLLDSGWHFIENIPYFTELELTKKDKYMISNAKNILSRVYSVGTGFIDKYYATPAGTSITEKTNSENILRILKKIV